MKVFAKLALCAAVVAAVGHSAQAGTVNISGSALTSAPTPLYGSGIGSNNVINSPSAPATGSGLTDPTGPNLNIATTPWLQTGAVSTSLSDYSVQWFYAGSESGFTISFHSGALNYTEQDKNNSFAGAGSIVGPQLIGTTTGTSSVLDFNLTFNSTTVTNGGLNPAPGQGVANLIYAYLTNVTLGPGGNFLTGTLSKDATDWFVFALNDNGGPDDNHDDFVGIGHVTATTPIPATLPLLGSVLGGGFIVRKLRRKFRKTV